MGSDPSVMSVSMMMRATPVGLAMPPIRPNRPGFRVKIQSTYEKALDGSSHIYSTLVIGIEVRAGVAVLYQVFYILRT